MRNISDKEYFKLCNESYKDSVIGNGNDIEIGNELKWKVLDSVDNKKSGLQGSALVPAKEYDDIKSGKKEPSNIVFVSRGTENLTDWGCNISDLGTYPKPIILRKVEQNNAVKIVRRAIKHNIVMPTFAKKYALGATTTKNNQFVEYEDFVNETVKKYNPKDYTFTGHSLGGALAQYVGVLHDKKTVTYSAARAYRLLPKEYQERVKSGYYDDKIVNYKHEYDPVGHVPLGELIGRQLFVQSNVKDFFKKGNISDLLKMLNNPISSVVTSEIMFLKYMIDQHVLDSFDGAFTSDGAIKLLVDADEVFKATNILRENIEYIDRIIAQIEDRMDTLDRETNRIYQSISEQLGVGEFNLLSQSDLDEIMDEIVPYKPNRFYDREKGETLIYALQIERNRLGELINQIENGVRAMQDGDLNAANLF